MVRILVLSFYYKPDFCAGSFRNTAVVEQLSKELGQAGQIDVMTTQPNRYHTFLPVVPECEIRGNIKIWRVTLPAHQSGMMDQSRAFLSYAKGVFMRLRGQSYDLVYASSARLMTAALGGVVARRLRVPLYLDIRDIFALNMKAILRHSPLRVALPLFNVVEGFAIHTANRVNLVSSGFVEYFKKIDNRKDFRVFINGIDEEFLDYDFSNAEEHVGPKEILYAGNIGEGQGLHRIIPTVAPILAPNWRFRIIGEGGMRSKLERVLQNVDNVILEPPVRRKDLLACYKKADVLFLHLNDYPAFHKVLPSKIFEYGATGKPILAGVAGYPSEFVQQNIENAVVFAPCDKEGFVTALNTLSLNNFPRRSFVEKFRRSRIVEEFAKDIIDLGVRA